MAGVRGKLFMAGFCLMVMAANALLLSALAWWRSIKVAAAVFLLSATFGCYFIGTYRTVIDAPMMLSVLQTNWGETRDLLSLQMGLYVLVLGGLPLVWLWKIKLRHQPLGAQLWRNAASMLVALVVLVGLLLVFFSDMSSTMRNHKSIRYLINPLNSFYALGHLAFANQAGASGPVIAVGRDAAIIRPQTAALPPLFILVVGETARAANFSLYGYPRETNPELKRHQVLAFENVTSCGTNTATSVPCMFSSLGKAKFQAEKRPHETLLDVAQHAGMAVLWIDNQAGCKGVCERVPHVQTTNPAPGTPPMPSDMCDANGECLDGALLHGLNNRMETLDPSKRAKGVLLVMHQMGSHGPAYSKRSPSNQKPFMPECKTNVLQQCDKQALINAYDNSIAYTDHVLAQAIGWLKSHQATHSTGLLYVSDHGESLGEKNLYLHGMPFSIAPKEQTHVPMIAWLSQGLQARNGLAASCLPAQLKQPVTHDHLFHTTLGLLGISTHSYRAELDALQVCRNNH